MKKQLTTTGTNKLVLAKAEFKKFRKEQSKQVQQSAPPTPVTKPLALKTAHKILLCSTHQGKLSRVDYDLSDTTATAFKATAIQPSSARSGAILTPDLDSVLLKRKIERSSAYNGCPHCGKMTICYCSYCNEVSCSSEIGELHKCPNCQREYRTVTLTDAIDLTANRERPSQPPLTNTPRTSLPRRTTKALPKTTTKALPQHPKGLLPKK